MTGSRSLCLLVALAALGCGKSSTKAEQVRECSAISFDTQGTATCLVQLHQWEPAAARAAAVRRHRELDSLKTRQQDSVWNLDAMTHRIELARCRRGPDPLDRCLLTVGWPLARVNAVAESLWQAELPTHRRELQACQARRDVNLASCLTLYYKWDSDRALRIADSITRARLGGQTRQ